MRVAISVLLYSVVTRVYYLLIKLISPIHAKAGMMVKGRYRLLARIRNDMAKESRSRVWFHCASLGEFEQARPLIEAIKVQQPDTAILLSFFSPSGYEVRKNYPLADYVYYLPFDTYKNAKLLIEYVAPKVVVFVKYEFWYFFLSRLHKQGIPVFLISAHFTANQVFFKPHGYLFRKLLTLFETIFTQYHSDVILLRTIHIQSQIAGDTRYDRAKDLSNEKKQLAILDAFCPLHNALILGSSYAFEEQITYEAMHCIPPDIPIVIAPHEVNEDRISEIERLFEAFGTVRYSVFSNQNARVLIIDNVGMLSTVYGYGRIAIVGGGFGNKGLHNILEPLAKGCLVLTGPKHHDRFPEISDAIQSGVAYSFNSATQFTQLIDKLYLQDTYLPAVENCTAFIKERSGATQKILPFILKYC